MKVFWVLCRLRMLEVLRRLPTGLMFFALPPLLLAVTGLVFRDGHPFERRRVALVGDCAGKNHTISGEDVLSSRAPTKEAALRALETHVVNAVVTCDGAPAVFVEARDRRFGEALARELEDGPARSAPAALTIVPSDRLGYVRYVFSGLVAYVILLSGLYGMGYTMVRYRQARFLKKLATTPLSPAIFVLSQLCARSLLVGAQIALLILSAVAIIGLRLDWTQTFAFYGIALCGLWTAMAIGFAIAQFVENADVLSDTINAAGIPLIFLSEVFFPLDVLPAPLTAAAAFLPTTELVRVLRGVTLDGSIQLLPFAGLCAWALLCSLIVVALFRWDR